MRCLLSNIHLLKYVRGFHQSQPFSKYSDIKVTLFSKPECGLCVQANEILNEVLASSEFKNTTIPVRVVNINKDQKWWNEYCFDIPVLHIEDKRDPEYMVKIMHFFKEDEIETILKRFKD